MKRKQKGFVDAMFALVVLGFVMIAGRADVTFDTQTKAPNEPVHHNYNGGFTK